jgi:hypothetical protein
LSAATFTSLLPQGCSLANKDSKTWSKVVPRVLAQRFAALRLILDRKKVGNWRSLQQTTFLTFKSEIQATSTTLLTRAQLFFTNKTFQLD